MDFLTTSSAHITLIEVALLLFLATIANMFGKPKLALLITCFFTLFWGFFLNYDMLFVNHRHLSHAHLFFGFPFAIVLLTLLGLLRRE